MNEQENIHARDEARALFEFANLAREFVELMARCSTLSRREFFRQVQPHLTQMLRLAPDLPSYAAADEYDKVSLEASLCEFREESMPQLQELLSTPTMEPWLPTEDSHGTTTDPFILADGLSDIWKALRIGLALWDREDSDSREQAAWQFYFEFNHHCNHHAEEILDGIRFFEANAGNRP